jgi:hypothetical protein
MGLVAPVRGTGHGKRGFRLELVADFVEVDLLHTERQGGSSRAEGHDQHSQRRFVARARRRDVTDGENQMVERANEARHGNAIA